VAPSDVALQARPVDSVPVDAVDSDTQVGGRVVAVGVRAGEPMRERDLVTSSLVRGLGAGLVATPVRLADATAASLLAPGDVVDVLSSSDASVGGAAAAQVVASGVRVLVAGVASASSDAVIGSGGRDGALLVVATTPSQALDLAQAAASGHLSITLRPA
jgi:Flp pilus assembly protein CpaB